MVGPPAHSMQYSFSIKGRYLVASLALSVDSVVTTCAL